MSKLTHALLWLVLLASVRLIGLGDYPQIHPDEGFWTQGPRNAVLYGEPFRDGRLHPFLCPGHFAVLTAFFSVGPASLLGGRCFSVLMGLATCALMGVLAHRLLPRRPWLLLGLFGLSTFTILIQRLALLEADQMFWMVLAAVCWLSAHRLGPCGAGMAFGMALLVKSNSLYLLPAFALALPPREVRNLWSSLVQFGLACVALAGGGYLFAWWLDPVGFTSAFRFELKDQVFEQSNYLVRVGRFGINPDAMRDVLTNLLSGEPFLPLLAAGALVLMFRHRHEATQADRFFAGWMVLGLCFHLPQIFVEHRYLTTLAPAFAYLSARLLDHVLANPPRGWTTAARLATTSVLAAFLVFHAAKLTRGLTRDTNDTYWQTIAFLGGETSMDARVLASSKVVQSTPRVGFDFFRLMVPYDRSLPHKPLARLVAELDVSILVIDDDEWDIYLTSGDRDFLTTCRPLAHFGEYHVCETKPFGGKSRETAGLRRTIPTRSASEEHSK